VLNANDVKRICRSAKPRRNRRSRLNKQCGIAVDKVAPCARTSAVKMLVARQYDVYAAAREGVHC